MSVHSRAAALALAETLLARAELPPGETRVSGPPDGALDHPAEHPGKPDLVEVTRLSTTVGSVSTVMFYLDAHVPRGSSVGDRGGSTDGATSAKFVEDGFTRSPVGVESADLLIAVSRLARRTVGVRPDAQATWLPVKPTAATVPREDRVVILSIDGGLSGDRAPAMRRVVVTNPRTVTRLATDADTLPGARSSPSDDGTRDLISFTTSAPAPPNLVFTAGFCGLVGASNRRDHFLSELSDSPAFSADYTGLLHLNA